MAVEAPAHLEGWILICQSHLINAAVAGLATNTFFDMNTVIEIDKIREIVNLRPLD